jgi:hypothetical protein
MTIERKLSMPAGYDEAANPRTASFAAQLDDQLTRLKKDMVGLEVRHLEWQPHPGTNTIGMLLAHLAVVDVWWIRIAPYGLDPDTEGNKVMADTIGIHMDDDGLPCPPDGTHAATLSGKSPAFYLDLLEKARAESHRELHKWRDADLGSTYPLRDRIISREWTLYHVLEHFAGHYGQILLLKHLMRDAGILPPPEKN